MFSIKDEISPSFINLSNPKIIQIEDMFYSSLLCVNYQREQNELILKKLIEVNSNLNISIFYEKQDTNKVLREITYYIGNIGVEIEDSESNRQDMDIAASSYTDAKYIRKEIQINNEELYYIYIYLTVFSKEKNEVENMLNKIETISQSSGIRNEKGIF